MTAMTPPPSMARIALPADTGVCPSLKTTYPGANGLSDTFAGSTSFIPMRTMPVKSLTLDNLFLLASSQVKLDSRFFVLSARISSTIERVESSEDSSISGVCLWSTPGEAYTGM